MRDPNRIDKVMARLTYFWHLVPDFRLWQIICAICEFLPKDCRDPFYLEDDKWLMAIEYAIADYSPKKEEDD